MRPIRWLRKHVVVLMGLLTLVYLIVPNLVVLLFSFNKPKGRYNYTWNHFSTDAWQHPCGVADMCGSLTLSLRLAAYATIGATVLGTMTAFALARYRFRGRAATNMLIFLPMAMPEVVMGASLGTLFLNMRIQFGFWTILMVVAVKARVMSMDPRLEQAAQDLYASPAQTFLRVTLPLAAPGIAAGALLSFALSFDDYIITSFNAGSTVTFPMFVWGSAQRGTPVQVNVIGTAMFAVAVLLVLAGQFLGGRRKARG
jgi:spermidine/putrescine transport system permease protein